LAIRSLWPGSLKNAKSPHFQGLSDGRSERI
jgi:hypothetical protein